MHPALAKAKFIGKIAHQHNWKGNISSEVVDGQRITSVAGNRDDEAFSMQWTGEKLTEATYSIGVNEDIHAIKITHSKKMIEYLTGWPDIFDLFKWFPNANRPLLVEKYRKLPFSMDDDNEEIISKLLGCKIFWYGHQSTKYHTDVVLPTMGNKTYKTRIVDIGHRKLFHFIGAQAGFRSVLLDTLLKVA
jgi:hypothetical protein